MIIGVGTDLCDIRRIDRTLEEFDERFTHRVYDESERLAAERRANRASAYAIRFAAKEACSKALGTGLRQGVFWRDMVTANEPSGKPYLRLYGGALARLEALTPAGYTAAIDVSMTDEFPLAHAIVIISATPE